MISNSKANNTPYPLIIIFVILAVSIGLAGYVFYDKQKTHILRGKQDELSAIADLKVGQLTEWRKGRLADADSIFKNHLISRPLRDFFERPQSSVVRKDIITWLMSLYENDKYKDVQLFDAQGNMRMSLFASSREVEPLTKRLVAEALINRKVIFEDFHNSERADNIHLSLIIPIQGEGDAAHAAGVLLLEIDPYQFLYPLIQVWPTPSETAETLLVRREGDDVVFLNELRHRKNTALSLRIPVTRQQLPAAMAVLGKEGIVEGLDYRAVTVIAAIRSIPDSPWFIVSKVDKEEIYAPLRERVRFVAAIVFVLIIAAGLSVAFLWRHQRAAYYQRQYKAELRFSEERKQAVNLLLENEHRLKKAQEIAHLGSWEFNLVTHTLAWSDETYRIFGFQPQEFAVTYDTFLETIHPDDRKAVDDVYSTSLREGRDTYEIEHRIVRKSTGEIRYVYEKCEHVRDETGRIVRSVGMVHDITDHKQAEEALRKSEQRIRDIASSLGEGVYVLNNAGAVTFMNPEAERLLGWTEAELMDKNMHDVVHYRKSDGTPLSFDECRMHTMIRSGTTFSSHDEVYIRKDGTTFPISIIAAPLMENGRVTASVTAFRDISDIKQAEQDREKLIADLQKALSEIKTLHGILPICSSCKRIRDDKGSWRQLEAYISEHTDSEFSHALCQECAKKLYPQYFMKNEEPAS